MANVTQAKNDIRAGYAQLININGTDLILESLDGTTKNFKGHIVPLSKDDTAIANALGIDAVFIHALATPPLLKFEKVTAPSGREYVIESVHEIYVDSVLVGLKGVAR